MSGRTSSRAPRARDVAGRGRHDQTTGCQKPSAHPVAHGAVCTVPGHHSHGLSCTKSVMAAALMGAIIVFAKPVRIILEKVSQIPTRAQMKGPPPNMPPNPFLFLNEDVSVQLLGDVACVSD